MLGVLDGRSWVACHLQRYLAVAILEDLEEVTALLPRDGGETPVQRFSRPTMLLSRFLTSLVRTRSEPEESPRECDWSVDGTRNARKGPATRYESG